MKKEHLQEHRKEAGKARFYKKTGTKITTKGLEYLNVEFPQKKLAPRI